MAAPYRACILACFALSGSHSLRSCAAAHGNKKPEAEASGSLSNWFESVEAPTLLRSLLADSKFTDHVSVAFDIVPSQIIEQATPLAYDLQQPPAGAVVFLMCLEMFCEVRNALAKNGNLDFGRTRI